MNFCMTNLKILGKAVLFDHTDLIKICGTVTEEEEDEEEAAIQMSVSPKTQGFVSFASLEFNEGFN